MDKATNEVKRLQTQLKFLQDDAMGFVKEINRLKQVLYRIASMSDDPEFGVPPMKTVTKIAQDALYDEGPRRDDRGDNLDGN